MILIDNAQSEFELKPLNEDPHKGGFNENVELNNGTKTNGYLVAVFRGLTPTMPLRVHIKATGAIPIRLRGVLHQHSHDQWLGVPAELPPLRFPRFGNFG